jgi:hypothetical protein
VGLATEQWIMLKRTATFCLALFGCALHASAQGFYTTANAITSPGSIFPNSFNLEFRFEPGAPVFGFGYHIYTIDSNLKLVFNATTLGGVQAGFSVVQDGDVLDQSHIDPAGKTLNGYQLTLNQPFLVGMDMINLSLMTVTQQRFGWARLEYTASGLQILGQATALGGNGIIAGTTTVLPEPSTLSLITAGAVGLLFAHRRLRSRRRLEPRL